MNMTTYPAHEERPTCSVCATGKYEPWGFAKYCEKHDVCIGCRTKRKDLTDTPWGVRIGAFQCKDCEIRERQKSVKERQAKGFSHNWENEITCPHCGYENSDSWECGEDGEQDCSECEESFKFERHTMVYYSTEALTKAKTINQQGE
jgi:hypothetical protein